MQPMLMRLVLLVVVVGCGLGIFFAVDSAETLPLRQAQDSALNRFGANLIDLCQNATKSRAGSWPADVKITVINSDAKTVYDVYDSALPDDLRATDKSNVTVLLCLAENKSVYATDEYGDPTKYTCTRYARDLTGYLVDVKTGATINYHNFDGQQPPECPDETDSDISRTGDIPFTSNITSWLAGSVGQNA